MVAIGLLLTTGLLTTSADVDRERSESPSFCERYCPCLIANSIPRFQLMWKHKTKYVEMTDTCIDQKH